MLNEKGIKITAVTVGELIEKLRTQEWMIPAFQRSFVWTTGDVSDLVSSILERRPIGMATLWEQPSKSDLGLEPVSIPDSSSRGGKAELAQAEIMSPTKYAVLDGRQRCTAIAMAFGGLRPKDGRVNFCGRFFLNLAEKNEARRIEYVKETHIVTRGLDTDSSAFGKGLFPLSSSKPGEPLMGQWYRYAQAITNEYNYPDSKLPDKEELEHRNRVLERSFKGILETQLAVNIVPASYSLANVCEIFEVLNTTGTKVSTVDLIHSWLYSETFKDEHPLDLRDWIDKLGEHSGAVGWSSSTDRPELIAQMTTATYVSLVSKPEPRTVGRIQNPRVTSVKSGDLLATPTLHWKNVRDHEKEFVKFLGDFQQCVADGAFGWKACPYPVTASIYVGLRWHYQFDIDPARPWKIKDLNALFRAFFWRNALSSRYDQGFLTQLGADMDKLKQILNNRSSGNFDQWASEANNTLDAFMNKPVPKSDELRELYTNRQTGALQKALLLPIVTSAKKDILNPEIDIEFPARTDIQLHHIYPKSWCRLNRTDNLSKWLDTDADQDWVGSAANLMPLSRESNLEWRDENPGSILLKKGITYDSHRTLLSQIFVSEEAFNNLLKGSGGIPCFWETRADTLASHLERLLDVAH